MVYSVINSLDAHAVLYKAIAVTDDRHSREYSVLLEFGTSVKKT